MLDESEGKRALIDGCAGCLGTRELEFRWMPAYGVDIDVKRRSVIADTQSRWFNSYS